MTTPITKRLHMNAFKKASVAKQTRFSATEKVKDKEGNLLVGSATGSSGKILTGTKDKKIPGKKVEKIETDNQKYLDSFKAGFKKDPEGFSNIDDYRKNKEKKYKGTVVKGTKSTQVPGNVKFDYKPELTKKKKGSNVDTSTYWSTRDDELKAQKLARNKAYYSKKMTKYGGTQNELGEWVIGEDVKPKDKRKFQQYKEMSIINNANLSRATSQSLAGKDSQITARFEHGTKMEKAQKGGESVKAPDGTKTKEKFEDENRAKTTAGNVLSKSGENKSETVNNAVSNSAKGFTDGLKQKTNVNPFEDKNQDSPRAYDVKSMTKDFSTSPAPIFKKYGSASSMLKKSGMKMGGFGSKTYKK